MKKHALPALPSHLENFR